MIFMKYFIFIPILFLISCETSNIRKYENIDLSEKTIIVPSGSNTKTLEKIKDLLKNNGFKLIIGEDSSARYKLDFEASRTELLCFPLMDELNFKLSLIDLKNKSEILSMGGKGCGRTIYNRFEKALFENKN